MTIEERRARMHATGDYEKTFRARGAIYGRVYSEFWNAGHGCVKADIEATKEADQWLVSIEPLQSSPPSTPSLP